MTAEVANNSHMVCITGIVRPLVQDSSKYEATARNAMAEALRGEAGGQHDGAHQHELQQEHGEAKNVGPPAKGGLQQRARRSGRREVWAGQPGRRELRAGRVEV